MPSSSAPSPAPAPAQSLSDDAKRIYHFGKEHNEGSADLRDLLGGKGANLCEMAEIGLNVPPGFIVTTQTCQEFYTTNTLPQSLVEQLPPALHTLERHIGKKLGDPQNPLLVSVRSGARVSMPGMMDTILNLGLNDSTLEGLAQKSNNRRFALDSYRRFIHMFGNVVLQVPHYQFESALDDLKRQHNINLDTDLEEQHLFELIQQYKNIVQKNAERPFPQNPLEQLKQAIAAVFQSWLSPRAKTYRKLNNIPEHWGTAVTIQAMAFGNMGSDCMTGVAFTRNPATGENCLYGEFLENAQGEDVVAGTRTPQPVSEQARQQHIQNLRSAASATPPPSLETSHPRIFQELLEVRNLLERHYRDMQDIEFTVEQNRLFLLQTRSGKRTAQAAVKIACDLLDEGLVSREEALFHIEPQSLDQLLHARLDPNAEKVLLTRGLPASPGAACGQIVFSADAAEERTRNGQEVMLVRLETSPEDIHGMHAAKGILTARGGMTSHAAVVARGMGRTCVCGASELVIDAANKTLNIGKTTLNEGDFISIDGAKGEVYLGKVAMILPELDATFHRLMGWCDETRRMQVRANADTAEDATLARAFGAEGIGLCRTEHMFFDGERITAMRAMILALSREEREAALSRLLPMQREDFVEIFTAMDGLPVTIRLLDPPLHEFLPHNDEDLRALVENLAPMLSLSLEDARLRTARLQESNPMLGHRGARLLATYPEICEMQARAIFEAALLARERGVKPVCEIMLPLIATKAEFDRLRSVVRRTAEKVWQEKNALLSDGKSLSPLDWRIGTMIELPRAALLADEIAGSAEFFSFGTNDLTQTVWGISRDDAGSFLQEYERLGFVAHDPFTTLDRAGVGALMALAVERGLSSNKALKLGICGEHGGDPRSIAFCEELGLDYVSCSPYRVAIARLAAAQAAITERSKKAREKQRA